MNNKYALNPRSGRLIKKSTALYRKLVKLGEIIEHEEDDTTKKTTKPEMIMMKPTKPEMIMMEPKVLGVRSTTSLGSPIPMKPQVDGKTITMEPKVDGKTYDDIDMKKKLDKELRDIVQSHSQKFKSDLTQDQTDNLLKKLLYKKLCVSDKRRKKPKKSKYVALLSSDSEQDSDTE